MFCTNCGSDIQPGQSFCINCGEPAPGANAQAGAGYAGAQQMNANAYVNSNSGGYNSGYNNGANDNNGYTSGYNNGYNTGAYDNSSNNAGYNNGYNNGYNTGYNNNAYDNSGYNNGYNTGYNTGYSTGVMQPEKKGFPWLAVVLPLCLIGVIGGAYVYGTNQMKQNDLPDESDPVVYATTETTEEDIDVASNEDSVDDAGASDASTEEISVDVASNESSTGYSGTGSYSTMKKVDNTNSEFAAVDAKGYADTDYTKFTCNNYEYATAYVNSEGFVLVPNGGMNDNTVLRDKKMSDFCDYIDKTMANSDTHLNRELFYKVLAVNLVDPSMGVADDLYCEQSLVYALSFAVHFDNMQVDLDYIKTYREAPTRYYYVLSAFDIDDIWMVDFSNREIYMNKGTTLYESSGTFAPLSDESLALWFLMVEAYFDFND